MDRISLMVLAAIVLGIIWFLFDTSDKRLNKRVNIRLFKLYCEEYPTLFKKALSFYFLGALLRYSFQFEGLNEAEKRFKLLLTKKYTFNNYVNEVMNDIREAQE